jgi:hypothetical protein
VAVILHDARHAQSRTLAAFGKIARRASIRVFHFHGTGKTCKRNWPCPLERDTAGVLKHE